VPEALLEPCTITPLPERGSSWLEIKDALVAKDVEQRCCNKRFDRIRDWGNGEAAVETGKDDRCD